MRVIQVRGSRASICKDETGTSTLTFCHPNRKSPRYNRDGRGPFSRWALMTLTEVADSLRQNGEAAAAGYEASGLQIP